MPKTHEVDVECYNQFKDLHDACELRDSIESSLDAIGHFLCGKSLDKKLAIFLKHKHYSLEKGERIVRLVMGETYMTYVTRLEKKGLVPILWQIGEDGCVSATEWSPANEVSVDSSVEKEVHQTLQWLKHRSLGDIFGVARRDAYPESPDISYEKTAVNSRIQLISPMKEQGSQGESYDNTLYTFSSEDGVLEVNAQQKCKKCKGCFASERSLFSTKVASITGHLVDGPFVDQPMPKMKKLHSLLVD